MENLEKNKYEPNVNKKTNSINALNNPKDNVQTKQILTLQDRKNLTITGVEKMLSVKPDLIQLSTNTGNLQIVGESMEMTKLNLDEKIVEITGVVNQIRFLDNTKQPIFKRIFK